MNHNSVLKISNVVSIVKFIFVKKSVHRYFKDPAQMRFGSPNMLE